MKSGKFRGEASGTDTAVAEEGDEFEAAEALAGLARCECDRQLALVVTSSSQDPAIRNQQYSGCPSNMVAIPGNRELTVSSQLCSSGFQSDSASKLRQNLKDAGKEAKRLRRILANRESARQTIRRREAMQLELTRKAAFLLEENEDLKKKLENAVKEYNSLKDRNITLKSHMSKLRKSEPGEMEEEPKSSRAEISSSATIGTPVHLYNQSSLAPFFWSPILPSPGVLQYQFAPHPDTMSSSHCPMPDGDTLCSHQCQENSAGVLRPVVVLPIPCLLPFFTHTSMLRSHSGSNNGQNMTTLSHQHGICPSSDSLLHEESKNLSLDQNKNAGASSSARTAPVSCGQGAPFVLSRDSSGRHTRHHPNDTAAMPGPPEHFVKGLSNKNQKPVIESLATIAAAKARRRRKELMRLKNVRCHHIHTYY